MKDDYLPLYMQSSIGSLLSGFGTSELDRFISTLRQHLASDSGKNDIAVEQLLALAEIERRNRF